MSDWSSGYISDLEYLSGFHGDLAPSMIDLAYLINGVETPVDGAQYSYCELGCGVGFSASLLAAANPGSRFYAVDFNPAHIARGQALAAEMDLANLTLLESGFDELLGPAAPELPNFDYVTLHGVYSWVGPGIRQDIVRFLRRYVKPGGAVYVSYNAMPGWSLGIAVQRLLYEVGLRAGGDAAQRIEAAVRFAEKLQSLEAGFLAQNPFLDSIVRTLESGELSYLAHEYLNAGWQPMFFADVAADLSEAKLSHVGTTAIVENFQDLMLKSDQRSLIATLDDLVVRELAKDLCLPRRLRKDVFVRGRRRMTVAQRNERLRATRLALCVPRARATNKVAVPQGEATLNPDVYTPIFDALDDGPKTVGALVDMEPLRGESDANPAEIVGMLVGSGQALPVIAGEPASESPAKRFNRAVTRRSRYVDNKGRESVAAPLFGTGLAVNTVEQLCLAELADGAEATMDALRPSVWQPIRDRGEMMIKDGRRVETEDENLTVLGEMIDQFLGDRLPLLRMAGAV